MATIKLGAYVEPTAKLHDTVEVGFNSVVLSGEHPEQQTIIGENAVVGSNCTIYAGVTIASGAVVLSGAVVMSSVPPLAIVEGNPARITGYVHTLNSAGNDAVIDNPRLPGSVKSKVYGVTLHNLPNIPDMRGSLTVGEFDKQIPFECKRYFVVYDVPTVETRGEHAHIACHQFLIAVKGTVHVVADDGYTREEFVLDRPNLGLYLPPLTWGIQYRYSTDAVLLVFASHYYDNGDYIRDYDEFKRYKSSHPPKAAG